MAAIEGRLGAAATSPPLLLLDPARIYPTGDISALRGMDDVEAATLGGPDALEPISIGYADSRFFVVDGHRRLSAALRAGFRLVPGTLLAQDNDPVVGGLTAREFFASTVTMSKVYDWQEAHGTELEMPAHALGDPAAGALADCCLTRHYGLT